MQAVMFDMDGVLIDSEPAHLVVTREALVSFGLPVPNDEQWEQIFLGRPDRDGLTEWFLLHHITADIHAVMADKLRRFEEQFADIVVPFEDGQWLARQLHGHGVPLALVTGARRAEADLVMRAFGLTDVFRASVSADEVTSGKPDPQPYLLGASALGVDPTVCVVIEDAVVGLRAAEAAGAAAIVVDRIGQPERYGTVQPVTQLDEHVLADLLSRFASGGS